MVPAPRYLDCVVLGELRSCTEYLLIIFINTDKNRLLCIQHQSVFNAPSANILCFCAFHKPLHRQTSAVITVKMKNQLAQHAGLLSITSAVSHAHLMIYQLLCAKITLNGAKNTAPLVKNSTHETNLAHVWLLFMSRGPRRHSSARFSLHHSARQGFRPSK